MTASELLSDLHRLLTLKGENPFKIRAFEKASTLLAEVSEETLKAHAQAGTLTTLEGVGKGISDVLTEYLLSGRCSMKEEIEASLPAGLLEFTELPGLGPKKALQLIEELDLHSLSELEYACRENRLLGLKGFGEKLQARILEAIAFRKSTAGSLRIDDALRVSESLLESLKKASELRVSVVGELRRRLETVSALEFLVESPPSGGAAARARVDEALVSWKLSQPSGVPRISVDFCPSARFGSEQARLTASEGHWKALAEGGRKPLPEASDEEEFYAALKLPFIAPECRETGEEVALARTGGLTELVCESDIQGVFHAHTTRSDGIGSLEEMVKTAQTLGYRYLGITDHSQSAFYAQGLKPDTLREQEREIRTLQEKYPDLRIFWGIESDILADGGLDYDEATLARFDFVIASIHSRFQMDREQMTERLVRAIRNPATRMLGHLTGRLLLGRPAYALDIEKVIEEAAAHDVAIEINAHPARLDIDWRWGPKLREKRCWVAINPDAHSPSGLSDTRYGVTVARKALLPRNLVLNTRTVTEVESWLKRR
jgi:DNA polymerase (family 10)